jgi:hypothetical protein
MSLIFAFSRGIVQLLNEIADLCLKFFYVLTLPRTFEIDEGCTSRIDQDFVLVQVSM